MMNQTESSLDGLTEVISHSSMLLCSQMSLFVLFLFLPWDSICQLIRGSGTGKEE